jgi:hypothetical protein
VFPVYSTSVETAAVKRIVRVLRRAKVAPYIARAGVYNCRPIAGSSSWSQHSWGNAVDLFPKLPIGDDAADRRRIAAAVVAQAKHRTLANRGRRLAVAEVIDHSGRTIWTPSQGWHPYTGTTGDHVHVSGAPLRTGTPPCA